MADYMCVLYSMLYEVTSFLCNVVQILRSKVTVYIYIYMYIYICICNICICVYIYVYIYVMSKFSDQK